MGHEEGRGQYRSLIPRDTESVFIYYLLYLCMTYRLMGNLAERWEKIALAMPRFPSLFSKSMGFTL